MIRNPSRRVAVIQIEAFPVLLTSWWIEYILLLYRPGIMHDFIASDGPDRLDLRVLGVYE